MMDTQISKILESKFVGRKTAEVFKWGKLDGVNFLYTKYMNDLYATGTLIVSVASISFGVFNYLQSRALTLERKQAAMEKEQAVDDKTVDGKAVLLAEQFKWFMETNDKKFADIQASIKDAFLLANNHTHTVETKTDAVANRLGGVEVALGKLETIINERIPKKE